MAGCLLVQQDIMISELKNLSKCKGHTCIFWNSRSLLNKIEEIERIKIEASPEILGISETWLTEFIDDKQVQIDGYNLHRADRTEASGKTSGGGLVIYYKEGLDCTPLSDLNKCTPDIEVAWLNMRLPNTRVIYYGLVYRPPSGNVATFIEILDSYIMDFRTMGNCEVNIFGDMNIDLLQRNANTKRYREFLKRVGLKNMITNVTHIKNLGTGFSLLDHFLTTDDHLFLTCGSLATNASDHYFAYAVRKKAKCEHPKFEFRGRAYSKLVKEAFISDIEEKNWDHILECNDSDIAWENFKRDFLSILHKHAPLKTSRTGGTDNHGCV